MFYQNYGTGFAFVGNQYKLTVSDKEYFIDLLFYHLELRCYIVVELKAREFLPIDAGQLNFYLSAVDDILRKDGDNPTIGIILCQDKDKLVAEYALKDINKPVGVSEYKLLQDIPEYLQSQLPKAEEIELHIKDIEEIEMQPMRENTRPNHWLSVITLKKNSKVTPLQIMEALEKQDIETRPVWKPMHLQPVFKAYDFIKVEDKAVSEDLFERGVCLPSDTKNTEEDMERVIKAIKTLFEK